MINSALFTSKTWHWLTPPEIYQQLNDKFRFRTDACTLSTNPLNTDVFFFKDNGPLGWTNDGLVNFHRWQGSVFINPPYGDGVELWLERAVEYAASGRGNVVVLLPARTDTKAFHDYIYKYTKLFGRRREIDMAWAAGIIDGEGSIGIKRVKANPKYRQKTDVYAAVLKVTNTNRRMLEKMQRLFGAGSILKYKHSVGQDVFAYRAESHICGSILSQVLPYLDIKWEQALTVLEFLEVPKTKITNSAVPEEIRQKREEYYNKLRAMKKDANSHRRLDVQVHFIKGRLKFTSPLYPEKKLPAPFPSMIVIYRPA